MINNKRIIKSFTMLELLIVLGLIGLIAVIAAPFGSSIIVTNHFNTTQETFVSALRKAQAFSMSKKNDKTWGVCIIDERIRVYSDTCGISDYSEDYVITGTVTFSESIDTLFSKGNGEPQDAFSVVMNSRVKSANIELNEIGGITINDQ